MHRNNPSSANNTRQRWLIIHASTMVMRAVVLNAVVFSTAVMTAMVLLAASVAHAAQHADTQHYAISQGPLATVLAAFASAADIGVDIDHSLTDGKHSQGLQGEYALTAALAYILRGSGLAAQQLANSRYVIIAAAIDSATTNTPNTPNTLAIPTLTIEDSGVSGYLRDEQGYDAVYDNNASTVYMGRAAVRRNAGTNPADLLQGIAGVFSGDARNSGSIDVNIRGVQGPGRVPVIIDGTEQAITVYRGYNGVSNRNYIDPNLISSVRIHKGASNARDVNSGIGGALEVTTLIPADIIAEGADSGLELTITSGGNAVSPQLPRLHTGESAAAAGFSNTRSIGFYNVDKTLRIQLNSKSSSDETPLGGDDFAYRLAVANTSARFDFLAAYAYRRRGNYYAGSNNAGYYDEPGYFATDVDGHFRSKVTGKRIYDSTRALTTFWPQGDEVINTSSEMASLLLKSSWRVDNAQKLGFNYRHTNLLNGEIMPSRLITGSDLKYGHPQWPLSAVTAQAYNLDYRNTPNDNRWLDLHANLWRTHNRGHTYTSAGEPNQIDKESGLVVNVGFVDSINTRNGITLSNTMDLSSTLALTIGGNFQHQKLANPDGKYSKAIIERAGRRQEWGGNLSLAWQPNEALKFSGGVTYSAYWSFDDRLKYIIDAGGKVPELEHIVNENVTYWYTTGGLQIPTKQRRQLIGKELVTLNDANKKNQDRYNQLVNICENLRKQGVTRLLRKCARENLVKILTPYYTAKEMDFITANRDSAEAIEAVQLNFGIPINPDHQNDPIPLQTDAAGKYSFATHPCFNGEVAAAIAKETGNDKSAKITQCTISNKRDTSDAKAEKLQDDGWVPHLTASYQFTPYSRGYVKYSEFIRYPSMFESTMGFSAAIGPYGLDPEHAYNWEISYVHDLTQWLTTAEYADVKLAYYDNLIKGVIDTSLFSYFTNYDEKKLRGVELTMRYDGGRLFSNIAVDYVVQNDICDASYAARRSKLEYRAPTCFAFGFTIGSEQGRATPKLSANWALGARLLDRRLEIGSRVKYYSRDANADLDQYYKQVGRFSHNPSRVSFGWGNTLLVDGYAKYNVNERLQVEFAADNLTDQYYLDPLTRSKMPAPGRTLKLNLTARL